MEASLASIDRISALLIILRDHGPLTRQQIRERWGKEVGKSVDPVTVLNKAISYKKIMSKKVGDGPLLFEINPSVKIDPQPLRVFNTTLQRKDENEMSNIRTMDRVSAMATLLKEHGPIARSDLKKLWHEKVTSVVLDPTLSKMARDKSVIVTKGSDGSSIYELAPNFVLTPRIARDMSKARASKNVKREMSLVDISLREPRSSEHSVDSVDNSNDTVSSNSDTAAMTMLNNVVQMQRFAKMLHTLGPEIISVMLNGMENMVKNK